MVGREVEMTRREEREQQPGEEVVLEVEGLSAHGDRGARALKDVSLRLRSGEIVAVAGVAGNGQRELAEVISGLRAPSAGSISVGGRALRLGDPRDAISAGVAHVPEDRLGTGLAPSLSIARNTALKTYRKPPVSRGPFLALKRMADQAVALISRYDVKASGPASSCAQPLGRQPPEARARARVPGRAARADRCPAHARPGRWSDRDRPCLPARGRRRRVWPCF